MRQEPTQEYDPKPGVSISTLAYDYPPDYRVPEHAHGAAQLIYATRGVMEVTASETCWLIPPHFGVWIPARARHRIRMTGAVSMRTLYLRRSAARGLPEICMALQISPLFRELIVETVRLGNLRIRNPLHGALRDLLVWQLRNAAPVPTSVTLPKDERALAVAQAFLAAPGGAGLEALCSRAGISLRTIERVFQRELGISFELWRRQARLMKAVELLSTGRAVKQVAFDVGYRQPAAFIEMFRQTLGMTPKIWQGRVE
jgi:AraC-like DNA-binding protein